jgi:hypothetical protein
MKTKLKDLENKAQKIGINTQKDNDELEDDVRDPKLVESQKKIAEKNAINAIHKKFYAKFKEQKERFESKLIDHNEFLNTVSNKAYSRSKSYNNVRFYDAENKMPVIDVENHELMQGINSFMEGLKPCLPNITSKLPWQTSSSFKPHLTNQNTSYNNMKLKSLSKNSNSAKQLPNSKPPNLKSYSKLQFRKPPTGNIEVVPKHKMINEKSDINDRIQDKL